MCPYWSIGATYLWIWNLWTFLSGKQFCLIIKMTLFINGSELFFLSLFVLLFFFFYLFIYRFGTFYYKNPFYFILFYFVHCTCFSSIRTLVDFLHLFDTAATSLNFRYWTLLILYRYFCYYFFEKKMLRQYYEAPAALADILAYMNLIFTMLFSLECILKLAAFGIKVFPSLHPFHFHHITLLDSHFLNFFPIAFIANQCLFLP